MCNHGRKICRRPTSLCHHHHHQLRSRCATFFFLSIFWEAVAQEASSSTHDGRKTGSDGEKKNEHLDNQEEGRGRWDLSHLHQFGLVATAWGVDDADDDATHTITTPNLIDNESCWFSPTCSPCSCRLLLHPTAMLRDKHQRFKVHPRPTRPPPQRYTLVSFFFVK